MLIKLEGVNYIYNPGTANESRALDDISLTISSDQFIAIIGSTGSGKSTLIQILNSLKQPTSGRILYDGQEIGNDKKLQRKIRCQVGLVFQYPEYQLFAESVLKDVMYGPLNKGFCAEDAEIKAKYALEQVGIGPELFNKSPFELSGGEKRRAAIAGIMAMEPEILILDEPTAGLDPVGKEQILELVSDYQKNNNSCVIMVSHNMDEVARYAQRIIAMNKGKIILDGSVHEVFSEKEMLEEAGLSLPAAARFAYSLGIKGVVSVDETAARIFEKYSGTNK